MSETITNVELAEIDSSPSEDSLLKNDYELIRDVEVKLSAVIGETQLSVKELFELKRGSMLALETKLNESVGVFLNEKLVATGSIVAVDDSFGIEIDEILQEK